MQREPESISLGGVDNALFGQTGASVDIFAADDTEVKSGSSAAEDPIKEVFKNNPERLKMIRKINAYKTECPELSADFDFSIVII